MQGFDCWNMKCITQVHAKRHWQKKMWPGILVYTVDTTSAGLQETFPLQFKQPKVKPSELGEGARRPILMNATSRVCFNLHTCPESNGSCNIMSLLMTVLIPLCLYCLADIILCDSTNTKLDFLHSIMNRNLNCLDCVCAFP